MKGKVNCTCGWSWNKSDSSAKDMYICHECGRDNSNNMKNGGWLDNYGTQANYNDSKATASPDMVGDGFSNVGRNYSPAWGGQFQTGGSLPGSVGFTYARTKGIPSNGPYAKKTLASAQNGQEMQYYQNGLDFKPKSISRDGGWLNKYDVAQNGKKKFKLKDERLQAIRPSESTFVKKPNFEAEQAKVRRTYVDQVGKQMAEEKRRKKLTKEQREREDYNARNEQTGSIQAPVEESTWDRTKAIVSNPLTAFGYAARNESLPTRFQFGERNTLDNAVDWINPLQGAAALSEIPGELGRGEFLNAGLSALDAADLGVYAKGAKQLRNINPEGKIFKGLNNQLDEIAIKNTEKYMAKRTPSNTPLSKEMNPRLLDNFDPGDYTPFQEDDYMKWFNEQKSKLNPRPVKQDPRSIVRRSSVIDMNDMKEGGIIKDDMGQWKYPGEITEIGSNQITMEGVPYDVLGISDTGDTKLMKPGKNYKFKGKKVTEFPMAQKGKKVSGGLGIEDWWNNRQEIQSTYRMANEVDPFMKNWMNNPITQKKLNYQIGYLMDVNKKPIDVINENLNTLPIYDQKKMEGKKTSDFISNYKLQNNLSSEYPDSQFEIPFNNLREEPYVVGSYIPSIHSMSVVDMNDKGTLAHEMTHGLGIQDEMEHFMEYNYNQKPNPNYPEDSYKKNDYDYLKKDGMYPRIMDIRRELNLKPGQKVDKRIFNGNNKKTDPAIQDLREMYEDDEIIKILNTIADNSDIQKLSTAKNGRRQEQKGLVNLDDLTNFTNYNKPQPGGWLNKYN
jgi:hypothetical protein